MPAIEVRELVRIRGTVEAVRGISFRVEHGEIFGLLGPNGAGKTSTIEVLEGLEAQTGGNVSVLGYDMPAAAATVKSRIGVQLQTTGLPRYLQVEETLKLFASFYDNTADTVDLLVRLGIEKLRKRLNSKLSGGERQRVALALALVNNPDILFLDEPSTSLDPLARRELWGIIREWQAEGRTVFLTTHDMHEAESLCSQVAIMNEGRIAAEGTVASLIAGQAGDRAIWFAVTESPPSEEWSQALPAVTSFHPEPDGVLLYTSDPMATMSRLLEARNQGKLQFTAIEVREPSLEDVFLRLTGRRLDQ